MWSRQSWFWWCLQGANLIENNMRAPVVTLTGKHSWEDPQSAVAPSAEQRTHALQILGCVDARTGPRVADVDRDPVTMPEHAQLL